MVEEVASRVVNNIVRAYRFAREELGVSIPRETLLAVLGEAEHIALHELAHGIVRAIYPEIAGIHHRDPVLGECIDEVYGRMIELYISRRIGAYTHSFEEHAYELAHYTSLQGLGIRASSLEELYRRVEELLEEKRLRESIEVVARRCMEWAGRQR